MANTLSVYLEVGSHRTIAAAVDWPGWCRSGRDETTALQALFDYGSRYARVLRTARLSFQAPGDVASLVVVERLKGNATTDYGVPALAPQSDSHPLADEELRRLQAILKACWRAFDKTVAGAVGKELRLGPRGGGRDLDQIVGHVIGAGKSYLTGLGGTAPKSEDTLQSAQSLRPITLQTLVASAQGRIAERGPRGGKRWLPTYFVRREAWHVLDHIWEIEDRLIP